MQIPGPGIPARLVTSISLPDHWRVYMARIHQRIRLCMPRFTAGRGILVVFEGYYSDFFRPSSPSQGIGIECRCLLKSGWRSSKRRDGLEVWEVVCVVPRARYCCRKAQACSGVGVIMIYFSSYGSCQQSSK
jgi:hypothetical protein